MPRPGRACRRQRLTRGQRTGPGRRLSPTRHRRTQPRSGPPSTPSPRAGGRPERPTPHGLLAPPLGRGSGRGARRRSRSRSRDQSQCRNQGRSQGRGRSRGRRADPGGPREGPDAKHLTGREGAPTPGEQRAGERRAGGRVPLGTRPGRSSCGKPVIRSPGRGRQPPEVPPVGFPVRNPRPRGSAGRGIRRSPLPGSPCVAHDRRTVRWTVWAPVWRTVRVPVWGPVWRTVRGPVWRSLRRPVWWSCDAEPGSGEPGGPSEHAGARGRLD